MIFKAQGIALILLMCSLYTLGQLTVAGRVVDLQTGLKTSNRLVWKPCCI
jgi:hypothetical protein